jgi:hypothetical protein
VSIPQPKMRSEKFDNDNDDDDGDDNNNNVLQLGCHPVAVVILHVYKI